MNKLAAALLALLAPVFALSVHAQQADLVINQSDSPDPGPAGGVFTYQVRVDNNGPNTATSVVLSNTIPPGSTFIDATPTQGSCSGPARSPATSARSTSPPARR